MVGPKGNRGNKVLVLSKILKVLIIFVSDARSLLIEVLHSRMLMCLSLILECTAKAYYGEYSS
jgi:hypothetical protein